MKRNTANRFFSYIFLMIFFSKMFISIAPIIAAQLDAKSVNAAIMQLEIENDCKPADIKEISIKEYLTVTNYQIYLVRPVFEVKMLSGNDDHAKHIQPFYPTVPTPPPNV